MSGDCYYDVCSEDTDVEKEGEKATHKQERDKVPHSSNNINNIKNNITYQIPRLMLYHIGLK